MRRWLRYAVFAVSILLLLSLINSWSMETELRAKLQSMVTQLHQCTRQSATCMEESLTVLEQRDTYLGKVTDLEQKKNELQNNLTDYVSRLMKSEIQVNHTRSDVDLCNTELQSLKNLQVSKSAMLETLRLEKDTMTSQLADKKQKIVELEKEIEKLKSALTTKSVPVPPSALKITPAPQPPKLSSSLKLDDSLKVENSLKSDNAMNDPALDNDAKEDIEEANAINNDDGQFDPPL